MTSVPSAPKAAGSEHAETLKLIAERAREIIGSALAAVAIPMEATESLTVEIAVGMDAEAEIVDHVVAVLSEALTNIARHVHADRAQVALTTDGREVSLTVADNGVDISPDGRRGGLRDIAERAERLDGRFEVSSPDGGGATLRWCVPLPGTWESGHSTVRGGVRQVSAEGPHGQGGPGTGPLGPCPATARRRSLKVS
ncbi:sensor histidine kinase [Streptomyces sp. NPDC093261]|uniref:sensor histidine kinase n=1 Tax=Streptomyces sp. NPDC093261 TaxID=3366037 RepID=UPI0037FD8F0A